MPPPGPPGIAGLCFFGTSATIASVVMSNRDGGGVLQCGPHDLGRVDDALRHQVCHTRRSARHSRGVGVLVQDLTNDDRAIIAGVNRDLARWPGERLLDDVNAGSLIVVFCMKGGRVLGR
jgi:hypothetical protein